MKKVIVTLAVLVSALFVTAATSYSQGKVKAGPDPATIRDAEMEKDSLHNLKVAQQYFTLKKAYVGSLNRCEEVIAGNPNFSKIDEILFMAGKSSLFLAANKGKQKSSLYVITEGSAKRTLTPEEFRDLGRTYLSQLVNDYPQSKFREKAEEELKTLGGPKPKESSKQ